MKLTIKFLDDSKLRSFIDYLELLPYSSYSDDVVLDEKDVLSFKYYHGNTYIIAFDNNKKQDKNTINKEDIIGHVCIMHPVNKHGYHQEHVLEIHINVLPTYQCKGVGKSMLKFLITEIKKGNKKRGIKKIKTKMLANNEKVIKLFESFGFEKEAIMKKEWKLLIKDKKGKEKIVYEDAMYMSLFLK